MPFTDAVVPHHQDPLLLAIAERGGMTFIRSSGRRERMEIRKGHDLGVCLLVDEYGPRLILPLGRAGMEELLLDLVAETAQVRRREAVDRSMRDVLADVDPHLVLTEEGILIVPHLDRWVDPLAWQGCSMRELLPFALIPSRQRADQRREFA